ncbi:hypothetical protein CJI17_16680, partial [Aeromonas salmonicida]
MATKASARASRSVTCLSVTSTMWASPLWLRWVRFITLPFKADIVLGSMTRDSEMGHEVAGLGTGIELIPDKLLPAELASTGRTGQAADQSTVGEPGQGTVGEPGQGTVGEPGQGTVGEPGQGTVGEPGQGTVGEPGQGTVGEPGQGTVGEPGQGTVGEPGQG